MCILTTMTSRDDPQKREFIADAGNTQVPAILLLRSLGFVVRREYREDTEHWFADRADLTLLADSPMSLLGLATMRSVRGAAWKAADAEIDTVLSEYRLDT